MKRLIVLAAMAVGACAQSDAGLTRAHVDWCDGKLCGASIIDGKEKGDVALRVAFPDGAEVEYRATDVKAFRAFEVRAAVERALAETAGQAAATVASAVTKAVLGAAGIEAVTGALGAKAALEGKKMEIDAMKTIQKAP